MFGDAFPQVVRALDCCAQSSDSGRLLPLPTAGNFAEENTMSHPGAEASAAKAPKAPATSVVRGIIDERCESNASVGYKAPATNVVQGNIDEYRVLSAGVAYAEPTTRREGIYTVECQSPRSPEHRATSPTKQREVIHTVEPEPKNRAIAPTTQRGGIYTVEPEPKNRAIAPTTQRGGIYTVQCQSPTSTEHQTRVAQPEYTSCTAESQSLKPQEPRARLTHAADDTDAESTVMMPLILSQEAPNYAMSRTQAKYLTGTGDSFHDAGQYADITQVKRAVHKEQAMAHKLSIKNARE